MTEETSQNQRLGQLVCDELLRLRVAARAEVVGAGANDRTDIELCVDDDKIAAEPTAYRKDGSEIQVEEAERAASKTFDKIAAVHRDMHGYTLFISWHKAKTRAGEERIAVPPTPEHESFAAECRRAVNLLREISVWSRSAEVGISFDEPEAARTMNEMFAMNPLWSFHSFSRSDFPVLSRYCKDMHVTKTLGHHRAYFNSDLNWRHVCGDGEVVRRRVAEKCKKTPLYRARAPGDKCWLLIHSGTYPLSSIISAEEVPAMCDIARTEIRKHKANFDRAYWLNLDAPSGQGRLHPIWPVPSANTAS